MKVRVTKGDGWYADHVGEVFGVDEVVDENHEDFDTMREVVYHIDPESAYGTRGGRRIIRATDAEVIAEEQAPAGDSVIQPSHYTAGSIEVIDIIAQTVAGYDDPFVAHCVGTATKYLNRAPYKHAEPTEDLRKAARYLAFAIEHLSKGGASE